MEDSDNTVPSWAFQATGNGQIIAAGTASAKVTIAAGERLDGALVANLSASWAWITFGQAGAATAAFPSAGTSQPGVPLAPNSSMTVRPPNAPKDSSAQHAIFDTVAVVLQSGSGNVLVTPGIGV